jgi:hypothetical protein
MTHVLMIAWIERRRGGGDSFNKAYFAKSVVIHGNKR